MENGPVSTEKIPNTLAPKSSLRSSGFLELSDINLVEYLYRLIENLFFIIIAGVIGGVLFGMFTHYFIDPVYQSTAKLYLVNTEKSIISVSDLNFGSSMANDYMEIFHLRSMRERVVDYLGEEYAPAVARSGVSVYGASGTHMLYVTVSSNNPKDAMLLANAYANVGGDFIEEKMKAEHPTIMELAIEPTVPVSPNLSKNILMGVVAGIAFACGILFVVMLFDNKIKTSEEITRLFDIPVLGMMTDGSDAKTRRKYYRRYGYYSSRHYYASRHNEENSGHNEETGGHNEETGGHNEENSGHNEETGRHNEETGRRKKEAGRHRKKNK